MEEDMQSQRMMGSRSALVRSLARAGAAEAKDLEAFYKRVESETATENVPPNIRRDALTFLSDMLRAAGCEVRPPTPEVKAPPPPSLVVEAAPPASDPFEDVDPFTDQELGESQSISPIHEALREELGIWKKGWPDKIQAVPFLWKDRKIGNEDVYICSTWKVSGVDKDFLWNITGCPDQSGSSVIHSCKEDVLLMRGDTRVCVSEDVTLEMTVPKTEHWAKSSLVGATVKVRATFFLWALKNVDGRKIRFWVNERVANDRRGSDVRKFTKVMKKAG